MTCSLIAQLVKNLPAVQENWVRFLGWEDTLEKEMATHSNILAWRIPWIEEPDRLQSMGSQSQIRLQRLSTQHAHVYIYCHVHWVLSTLPSQFVPPSAYPAVPTSPFSTSVSPSLPCRLVHDWRGTWPNWCFRTVSFEGCCSRWIRRGAMMETRGYYCNTGSL